MPAQKSPVNWSISKQFASISEWKSDLHCKVEEEEEEGIKNSASFLTVTIPPAGSSRQQTACVPSQAQQQTGLCYLVEGAHGGLEHQVGVEEEGAQQGLRVGGQLGQDARQQQIDVERVGQHVLHARQ